MTDDRRIWRGFHYQWRLTSHRLPLLVSRFGDEAPEFGLRVGAWPPDVAQVQTQGCRLGDGAEIVARGVVELRLESPIGSLSEAKAALDIDVDIPEERELVVVLDGLAIDARVSPAGWHVGAIGAEIEQVGGDWIASALMRPSESPHAGIFGLGDWSWDQPCVHVVHLKWAALTIPRGCVRRGSGQTTIGSAVGTTIADWSPAILPAGPDDTCLLTGFALRLDAPARQRRLSGYLRNLNGRYLRELGVGVESGRPVVHLSNAPRFLIRLGAVLGLYVMAAMAILTIVFTPQWAAGAIVLAGIALVTFVWPRIWVEAPSVPWTLDASVGCVVLEGVASESIDATWQHKGEISRWAPELVAGVAEPGGRPLVARVSSESSPPQSGDSRP